MSQNFLVLYTKMTDWSLTCSYKKKILYTIIKMASTDAERESKDSEVLFRKFTIAIP